MKKPVYKVVTDHIQLSSNQNLIDLNDFVIGIQIRIYSTSATDLLYGLNQGPTIPLAATDLPASYGGFHVGEVPCIYEGNLQVRWNTGVGSGIVVLTRLVPEPVSEIEIC
jgi:hypothetical protein